MSNLAPVARVDKNGHIVTRHMKVDVDNNTHAQKIPPVTISAVASDYERSNRNLLDAVFGTASDDALEEKYGPGVEVIREFLGEHHISTILTLLQSTSEDGNKELRRITEEVILNATEASLYDRDSPHRDNIIFGDEGFSYVDFKRSWAVADVNGSLGRKDVDPERYKQIRNDMDKLRNSITYKGRNMMPPTPQYWRGMTALYESHAGDFPTDEARAQARDFVKWSGEQEDIALVIHTARERKTLDPRIISAIIDVGRDVPALIDGAL